MYFCLYLQYSSIFLAMFLSHRPPFHFHKAKSHASLQNWLLPRPNDFVVRCHGVWCDQPKQTLLVNPPQRPTLAQWNQFFSTKHIQTYTVFCFFSCSSFNMFTFAVKLTTFDALFDICFVDSNPSIRGFGARTELSNSFGSSLITQAWTKTQSQLTKAVGFRETSPKTTGLHSYNHTWQVLSSLPWNVHLRWDQIELPPTPPRGHAPQWRLKWFQLGYLFNF